MSINLSDYQVMAQEAIKTFWKNRDSSIKKQAQSGKVDQGERRGVTTGKNMNGFLALLENIVRLNDLKDAEICLERRLVTLPGYFRPTKYWDILVMHDRKLIAAIELKSQVGPSFGNNFNNRTEEAIGTALDLWTAYRENAFGDNPRPFVGWLILVEDCSASRAPVRTSSPHFPVLNEFEMASYTERYNLLCKKLVQERLYTAASVLLSPRTAIDTGEYSEINELTGLKTFVSTFAGHVAVEAARSNS